MSSSQRDTFAAVLIGASSGMRTLTPAAVIVGRGRLTAPAPIRSAVIAAAAGELIADKLPFVPSRTEPLPFLGRLAVGALGGQLLAGRRGALPAAAASAAATLIGYELRSAASRRFLAALLEDALAIAAANLAVATAG